MLGLLYVEGGAYTMKNRIKEFRARHDYTQEKLAQLVGITRQSLWAIENEDSIPGGDTMLKIAKVLREPVEVIFSEYKEVK